MFIIKKNVSCVDVLHVNIRTHRELFLLFITRLSEDVCDHFPEIHNEQVTDIKSSEEKMHCVT